MKLSVNILTWNNIKTIPETIDLLHEDLKDIDYEIIVVDNGSTDGTRRYATIANKENLGISKGKNQGIDRSQGHYIMLLDGDIIPVKNSIPMLLDFLESNEGVDAIGFHGSDWTRDIKLAEKHCHTLYNPRIIDSHCLFYGMFRRNVFNKCRMDESGAYSGVGYGSEDRDFHLQMKQEGIDQWFCSMNHENGKYYHEINSSIKNMGRQKYIETSHERNKQYLAKWGIDVR